MREDGAPMTRGLVFDIRKFSLHDGPGIRTTVFLKGCPLSCRWCHNPESRDFRPEILLRPERCLDCGACPGAASPDLGTVPDLEKAMPGNMGTVLGGSGTVPGNFSECPAGAREAVGRVMTAREVAEAAAKDITFFDESGGGVTFSGGEPLAQPEFLAECLDFCRAAGIRTAVDTSGWAEWRVLESIAARTDLFLYDLKLIDSERHRVWTGVPNGPILDNLRRLAKAGRAVWIRIPFVPGVNASDADMEAAARFIAALGTDWPVWLLPYHDSARGKYALRKEAWAGEKFSIPTQAELESAADIFRDRGISVRTGG